MKKNFTYFLSLALITTLSAAVFLDVVPKFSEIAGSSSPFFGIQISADQQFIYGDFDADGDVDIHSYKQGAPENDFYRNSGTGVFTKVTGAQNPFNNIAAKAAFDNSDYSFVADFDNDGDDDILTTLRGSTVTRKNVFYRNNNGVYQELEGANSPFANVLLSDARQLIYGDFDNDGDLDLHTYAPGALINDYWRNNGSGTFTQITGSQNPFNNLPDKAAFYSSATFAHVADWDNDGDDDIFVAKRVTTGDKVFCRNDGGVFTMLEGANSPFANMSIVQDAQFIYGDFDADGDIDIHISNGSNTIQTWLNNGSGTFTNATDLNTNPFDQLPKKGAFFNNSFNAFVADWDNDGDDDVFTTNRTEPAQNIFYRQSDAPPLLQSSNPANGATGAAVDGNIVLNFSKNVFAVAGKNIVIKRANNTTFATIPANNGQITGSGSATITINPTSDLDASTGFYVLIDEGAFKDAEGRIFEGISASNVVSFVTGVAAVAPTVSTSSVTTFSGTSATMGGDVTADGGASVTDRGVVWNTSSGPTVSNNKTQNGSGTGAFSQNIAGLPAGTHIYVRAYAINSKGTSYGNEVSFYTKTTVASINRTTSELTNAALVIFRITFNHNVTGLDAADFSLTTSGVTSASVASINGVDGKTFDVAVNTGSGNGTVRLDFTGTTTITPNAESAFTSGEPYTIYKVSQPGDYYRTKMSASTWGNASSWQSSPDNAFWIDATGVPAVGAASVNIVSGSTITLPDGGTSSATNLTNTGTLDTGTGTLTLSGTFTTTGIIQGRGTIAHPNFTSSGTISPGSSPGALSFTGNFSNTGSINMEIGGTTAGTDYDQLLISGSIAADGIVNVSFINGFAPTLGDEFTLIDAGTLSGQFTVLNLPSVTPKIWETTYDEANGTLKIKVINDPMPVTLVHFDAVKESGAVKLLWSTSEESNSSHFEIGRSSDGKNWITLGRVTSRGESRQVVDYSYTDAQPGSGINYYRLKMVDLDETFTYSRIREAAFGADNALVLYPNPTHNELYVNGKNNEMAEVWDAAGRLRLQGKLEGGRLNVQSLSAGTYHLRVGGDNAAVKRFVIIR